MRGQHRGWTKGCVVLPSSARTMAAFGLSGIDRLQIEAERRNDQRVLCSVTTSSGLVLARDVLSENVWNCLLLSSYPQREDL